MLELVPLPLLSPSERIKVIRFLLLLLLLLLVCVCVMKRVYPYVFVNALGSYKMGLHKQSIIIASLTRTLSHAGLPWWTDGWSMFSEPTRPRCSPTTGPTMIPSTRTWFDLLADSCGADASHRWKYGLLWSTVDWANLLKCHWLWNLPAAFRHFIVGGFYSSVCLSVGFRCEDIFTVRFCFRGTITNLCVKCLGRNYITWVCVLLSKSLSVLRALSWS